MSRVYLAETNVYLPLFWYETLSRVTNLEHVT